MAMFNSYVSLPEGNMLITGGYFCVLLHEHVEVGATTIVCEVGCYIIPIYYNNCWCFVYIYTYIYVYMYIHNTKYIYM